MAFDNITMLHNKKYSIQRLTWMIVVLLSITINTNQVFAAQQADRSNKIVPILQQSQVGPNPDGTYSWSYETGNSIKANEQRSVGRPKNDKNVSPISVHGSFSYIGHDKMPYHVTYTADENGFHPMGVHIPYPPEIPPAILKALQWIADHPEEDDLRK